jgi:hypothetical protein
VGLIVQRERSRGGRGCTNIYTVSTAIALKKQNADPTTESPVVARSERPYFGLLAALKRDTHGDPLTPQPIRHTHSQQQQQQQQQQNAVASVAVG